MELKLERSEYAKIATVVSAVVFVICAVVACVWYNRKGFDVNTTIAVACAVVCAVVLVYSSWMLARSRRSERLEDVEVVPRYVPADENSPKQPEKPSVKYKMPKH